MIIQAEFLRAVRSAFVPDFSPSHPLDELRQGQRLRGGQFEFNLGTSQKTENKVR